jgi:hypothetical protein
MLNFNPVEIIENEKVYNFTLQTIAHVDLQRISDNLGENINAHLLNI